MANFYDDTIQGWLKNPGSYQGSAGYQFGLDQALQGAQRGLSKQRGSGNVLAELARVGSGYAMQDFGNQIDRLGRLSGQEQQFQLGSERNRNDFALGNEQNRLTGIRDQNTFTLGQGQNENSRRASDQNFGLGMYRAGNDFALGSQANANNAMGSWWNYDLGRQRNQNEGNRNLWDQVQNWFPRG